MRTAPALLLCLLVLMAACGEDEPQGRQVSPEEANKALSALPEKTKDVLRKDEHAQELKKKVDDGEMTPGAALEEYLHGRDHGSIWDILTLPYWWVYIPIGLALVVVLGCLVDLVRRLARRRAPWARKKAVEYKHYVPRPQDPPPDPTPPPEPPAGPGSPTDPDSGLRLLPELTDEERERRDPGGEHPSSDDHPSAA